MQNNIFFSYSLHELKEMDDNSTKKRYSSKRINCLVSQGINIRP